MYLCLGTHGEHALQHMQLSWQLSRRMLASVLSQVSNGCALMDAFSLGFLSLQIPLGCFVKAAEKPRLVCALKLDSCSMCLLLVIRQVSVFMQAGWLACSCALSDI